MVISSAVSPPVPAADGRPPKAGTAADAGSAAAVGAGVRDGFDAVGPTARQTLAAEHFLAATQPLLQVLSLEAARPPSPAERAVRVDAQDLRSERDTVRQHALEVERGLKSAVDALDQDGRAKPAGPGVRTRVDRDAKGHVTRIETSRRSGAEVSYALTVFQGGQATRETLSFGPAGVRAAIERWAQEPSGAPPLPSSETLLGQAKDPKHHPDVRLSSTTVRLDPDATRVQRQRAVGDGVDEVEQTYRSQLGAVGAHPELVSQLDAHAPTEVLDTTSTRLRRGLPVVTDKSIELAQGQVRIRGAETHQGDLRQLSRTWSLERQQGNDFVRQEFAEGNPDFTVVTRRHAEADSVSEHSSTSFKDSHHRSVTLASDSTERYSPEGELVSSSSIARDGELRELQRSYSRALVSSPQGLILRELTQATRTEPNKKPLECVTQLDSLVTGSGRRPLLALQTLEGPSGTAVTRIDATGKHVTLNGKPLVGTDELNQLSGEEKQLIVDPNPHALRTFDDFLGTGGANTLKLLQDAGDASGMATLAAEESGHTHSSLRNFINTLNPLVAGRRLSAWVFPPVTAVGGVLASTYSASNLLHRDLPTRDWTRAGLDAFYLGAGGEMLYRGTRSLFNKAYTVQTAEDTAQRLLEKLPFVSSAAAAQKGSLVGKFMGVLDKAGGAGNVVVGGMGAANLYEGIKDRDPYRVAEGGASIAAAFVTARFNAFWGVTAQLSAFLANRLLTYVDPTDKRIAPVVI